MLCKAHFFRFVVAVLAVTLSLRAIGTSVWQIHVLSKVPTDLQSRHPPELETLSSSTTPLHSNISANVARQDTSNEKVIASLQRNDTVALKEKVAIAEPPNVQSTARTEARTVDMAIAPFQSTPIKSQSSTAAPQPSPVPAPIRTLAFSQGRFSSGFRNEGMVFTWFVMYAAQQNFSQILIDSINWKDLHGNRWPPSHAPHRLLFDVEHWNSFYPKLPKLVSYDPKEHYEFHPGRKAFLIPNSVVNATRPYAYGTYVQCMNQYRQYTKRLLVYSKLQRDPVELLMMQGAFRPSPDLQRHIDALHDGSPYLALHARIEPDMQRHPVCRDYKVVRLADILRLLEEHFPQPTFTKVFIATNRPMIEKEVSDPNRNNSIAEENLNELNRARREGLWNGTVQVFEAGVAYISQTNSSFSTYAGISGAAVDYFLAIQAQIVVGTEVSSFSSDLIQTRFFNNNRENYLYRPTGLHLATPPDAKQPPRFAC